MAMGAGTIAYVKTNMSILYNEYHTSINNDSIMYIYLVMYLNHNNEVVHLHIIVQVYY